MRLTKRGWFSIPEPDRRLRYYLFMVKDNTTGKISSRFHNEPTFKVEGATVVLLTELIVEGIGAALFGTTLIREAFERSTDEFLEQLPPYGRSVLGI